MKWKPMELTVEEFIRHISNSDIYKLVGEKREEFKSYLDDALEKGEKEIVIRFLLERQNGVDELPTPYYVWVVYPLEDHTENYFSTEGEAHMYGPADFDDPTTYLEMPEALQGKSYFEVSLG